MTDISMVLVHAHLAYQRHHPYDQLCPRPATTTKGVHTGVTNTHVCLQVRIFVDVCHVPFSGTITATVILATVAELTLCGLVYRVVR